MSESNWSAPRSAEENPAHGIAHFPQTRGRSGDRLDPLLGGGNGAPRYATALEQNYPNPFNGTTTIHYSIGGPCGVELGIYDPAGRVIRVLERTDRAAGRYSVLWSGKDDAGRDVASGVYFCRIKAGKYNETRKVLYLR